jgi:hypothetical protein
VRRAAAAETSSSNPVDLGATDQESRPLLHTRPPAYDTNKPKQST